MNVRLEISEMLKDLGVPTHLQGYRYLKYAIERAVDDASFTDAMVKEVYPGIAQHFNSTLGGVERSIRHSIGRGWLNGNKPLQDKLFRHTIGKKGQPTNSEFIATVADYIRTVSEKESE